MSWNHHHAPAPRSRATVCGRARARVEKLTPVVLAGLMLGGCGGQPPAPAVSEAPAPPAKNAAAAAPAAGCFEDVTAAAGLVFQHQLADGKLDNIMESDGAGGTVLDFNNDGYADVYLVNSGPAPILSDAPPGTQRQPNRLFRNRGDGSFEDVTARAGVAGHGFGTTAAAADYDNDGDTDLLVVNFGSLILYQNQGDGTFRDITQTAGLNSRQPSISATFLDSDLDGFLDLFVANYLAFDPSIKVPPGTQAAYPGPLAYGPEFNLLYRNRGDGTFEDISESSGIRIPGHRAMSVAPIDYDLDGDQDLYVSNDGTPNLLLRNDGKGHFKDVALQAGVALNQFGEAAGSMGATVGDADGDGLPDMFVTRFGNASLYLNSPRGFFEDRVQPSGILEATSRYTGWGGNFLDFDNDGDLDLFIVNGHAHFLTPMPLLLLENTGRGNFSNAAGRGGSSFRQEFNARGSLAGDFHNDGRIDLVISTLSGPAVLLKNTSPATNHWLCLKLEGTQSNRNGYGALVRVTGGGRTWSAEKRCPTAYVSQSDDRLHFGLGPVTAVDIEIRWPSGQRQSLTHVAAGQVCAIIEPGASRWTKQP